MSGVEPYVDGRPLRTIGAYGDLEWTERFAGGCWEASWRMVVRPGWHHPALRAGADVELRDGAQPVWVGRLTEPDRGAWEVKAQGLAREGEQYPALNLDGSAATNVTIATSQAISRGLPWAPGALPSWPSHANPVQMSESDGLNTVAGLWDAAAEAAGRFWGIGPDRSPYAAARPTSASLRVRPGAVVLGVADDDFATHLVGRYRTTTGGYATVIVGDNDAPGTPSYLWGRREKPADLTSRKAMTAAQAESILAGMLAKALPRPGYTAGFEVDRHELTTIGGTPTHLPFVRPGVGVRLQGVVDASANPVPHHDIVIGEIRHRKDSPLVYIEPLGLADRNLSAVLEGTDSPRLVA